MRLARVGFGSHAHAEGHGQRLRKGFGIHYINDRLCEAEGIQLPRVFEALGKDARNADAPEFIRRRRCGASRFDASSPSLRHGTAVRRGGACVCGV
jgi:hypothetical protein